ncbi:hypothetical protein COX60_00505, partial [Candidatus Berkelbacteria bacterium CG_4_10_14_0_2_um_filter_35_9_33_12]
GSKISTLDETLKSEINNNTNLKKDQFSDIFKNDASIAVFRYYGNRAIINGIKNNPNIEKAEEQLLQDFKEKNPELYGSITFRVDRINEAQRVAKENSSIARKMERTITDPEIKRLTNEIETATKSMLPDVNNPSIDKIISGASNLLKLISQLLVEIDKPQNNDIEDKLEQYIENLYTLEKLAHEIISGETYENTRDIDIKNRNSDGSLLTDKDVIKFLEILSEKDTSKRNEEFTSFILSIGSRQLDNALDLPENSFYYMFSGSSTIVNISDSDTKICDENKQKEIDAIHKKYDLLEKELIDKALYSAPSAPLGTDPEAWQKEQFRQLDEQEKKEIQQTQSQSCKSSKSTINTSLSSDGFLIAIGQAKFEEYFDKKASSVNPKLIIRSSRKDIEDIDRGLSIEKGLTAKYLEDSIKLEEYFKAIGERTVELQLIDGLADDLSILGVALTATDIYNILNGDGEYTLARIGGLKIDETLDLPGGTGEAIISAKNNDERALAVAQVSGGWLFEQLGFNPLLLSGDISQRFAQDEIEKFFNFPQNSFKPTKTLAEIIPVENVNWFNRKTIFPTDFADEFKIDYKNKETGVLTYLSDTEYTRALVNKDKEYFDFLETDVQSRVLNYSPYYWRSDLNNLESPIYKRSAEIDNHFGLPKDTTKNFLLQVISPAQYIDLVQENYIGKQLENDIIKAGIKGLTDTICSNDDKKCKAIINTAYHDLFRVWYKNEKLSIEDWNAEDRLQFYHGLTAIFDVNLNEKAHLPTGTIEAVLADPANAEQTLIYGGLRSIEMEVGLERDKGKKPGYLTDAYNYYISHKSERKKTIPTEEEQKVCRENNGAKRHALEKEYEEKIQKTIYDIESSSLVDFQKQAEITRITGELEAEKQQKLADLDKNCLKEQRDHKDTLNNKSKTDKAKDRAMEELKEHLNDFFKNQLHVDLEGEGYSNHLEAIVRGDMQFLTYVGVASIAGELNSFEKDGQKIDLPPEYRITYEDVWKTQNFSNQQVKELSSLKTTEQIEMEYEIKLNQIIQDANKPPSPIPGFDEAESKRKFDELEAWKTDQLANIQDPEKKQEDIREENRRRFQGKVFTAFAYQIDQHIPADFGYVMFYGTDEQRLNTAFNYGVNYALDATNLNQYGITSKGVEALKNYLVDKSGTNWEIVKTSGIFGGIETLINQKDLFGFQLQEGSIAGLAEWAKTGDYTNLLNTYEDWATGRIFAFGDKLFGFEEGTTATIYQTYQAFDKAKDAYEAAKVAKTATDIAKAKAAYAEAATILITLIITMAFSDQIASMEESLGLVPGTGAILVGMVVGLFLGVPVDPITVVIFILINLIGVYKVKIYCTVDGYYPEPNYVSGGEVDVGYEENLASPTGWGSRTSPSQSLNVGGGVFDGMKSKKYQEGLKLGAQLKIKDTIGDTLDFPFYFDNNSVHISKRQKTPDDYSLPTQVLTFDQKHADTYWNTSIYKQVFKNNNPSENNKRGIGFSPLVPDHIHTGF